MSSLKAADLIEQIEKTEERGNNARTMSEPVSDDTRKNISGPEKADARRAFVQQRGRSPCHWRKTN